MLSRDDNELLARVGPDTAMGALIRQDWIPVLQSKELEPGGRVKRVMLLGERLVAYRMSSGAPGLIGRLASSISAGSRRPASAASITAGSTGSTVSAWRCRASRRSRPSPRRSGTPRTPAPNVAE